MAADVAYKFVDGRFVRWAPARDGGGQAGDDDGGAPPEVVALPSPSAQVSTPSPAGAPKLHTSATMTLANALFLYANPQHKRHMRVLYSLVWRLLSLSELKAFRAAWKALTRDMPPPPEKQRVHVEYTMGGGIKAVHRAAPSLGIGRPAKRAKSEPTTDAAVIDTIQAVAATDAEAAADVAAADTTQADRHWEAVRTLVRYGFLPRAALPLGDVAPSHDVWWLVSASDEYGEDHWCAGLYATLPEAVAHLPVSTTAAVKTLGIYDVAGALRWLYRNVEDEGADDTWQDDRLYWTHRSWGLASITPVLARAPLRTFPSAAARRAPDDREGDSDSDWEDGSDASYDTSEDVQRA